MPKWQRIRTLKDKLMIAETIKSQLQKGVLEYCVMQILQREEVYASDIIDELFEERLITVEGVIYPLLIRFKNEGLVEYEWQNSDSGLPKKHYRLTESGSNTVKTLDQTWTELSKSIRKIKKRTDEKLKAKAEEESN